jgi:hypothetical protein
VDAVCCGACRAQEELFGNISLLGKPTAVVLLNGGQVAVDTIAASNASLVEAFYPGQSGAAAIASVLFGDFNPCGKLDQTIYAKSFATEVKWWDTRLQGAIPGLSMNAHVRNSVR